MAFTTKTVKLNGSAQSDRKVELHETSAGKVIQIVMKERGGSFYEIEFESGGKKPKEFLGKFMSKREARQAIEKYLARMEQEKPVKATAKGTK